jgi:uncharacterized protein involved in exopolysaccharide biosynthesis
MCNGCGLACDGLPVHPTRHANHGSARDFELADLARLILSEPRVASLTIAFCVFASVVVGFAAKPQFESQALIDIGAPPSGDGALGRGGRPEAMSVGAEMRFMRSRAVLAKALHAVSGPTFPTAFKDDQDGVTQLGKALKVSAHGQDTRLVMLSLKAGAADRANRLLEEIIRAYIDDLAQRQSSANAAHAERIARHLPTSRLEVERRQEQLLEVRQRASLSGPAAGEVMARRIETTREAIYATYQEKLALDLRFTSSHPAQKVLHRRLEQLQAHLQSLSDQAYELRAHLSEIARIEVLRDKATTNYAKWLELSRETSVAVSTQVATAVVIDPPSIDASQRAVMSRGIVVVLGMLSGVLAAPVAAWAAKSLRALRT